MPALYRMNAVNSGTVGISSGITWDKIVHKSYKTLSDFAKQNRIERFFTLIHLTLAKK